MEGLLAQIQLPLSETNGTAPAEFYSKCPLFGPKRTSKCSKLKLQIYEYTP